MKLSDTLKNIKKATNGQSIEDSPFANISGYIDSGNYSINRILTGDIHKGFAIGRIHQIFGLSQSGKSYLTTQVAINALKNNQVDVVYVFDSEGGVLTTAFEQAGVDMSKIVHIPVESIELCAVKMLQVYDTLVKAREEYLNDPSNNDDIRALCILDSWGQLASDKLVSDAVGKDKMAVDMGLTPKLKNNLARGLIMRVVKSNATLLVINQEYQDPAAMFASKVKLAGGGKGIEYASHTILQCEKVLVKKQDNDFLTGFETQESEENSGFYKGTKLKFFTVKNRIARPFFTATMYLDFINGMSKYDGLVEDAVAYGYLKDVRGGYICPSYSEKRITYKDLVGNKEIWDSFIEDFNAESQKRMKYSTINSDAIDEIEKEIEEEIAKDS